MGRMVAAFLLGAVLAIATLGVMDGRSLPLAICALGAWSTACGLGLLLLLSGAGSRRRRGHYRRSLSRVAVRHQAGGAYPVRLVAGR